MFTARTGTEIFSGQQYGTCIFAIIKYKIRNRLSLDIISPVAEQIFSESCSISCLQEPGRDDLVGINIFEW